MPKFIQTVFTEGDPYGVWGHSVTLDKPFCPEGRYGLMQSSWVERDLRARFLARVLHEAARRSGSTFQCPLIVTGADRLTEWIRSLDIAC
jgi:hypothetical protein